MVREQRKPRCFRCLPLSACKLVGVGQRQRGLQQELRDAQEALAKDLGAVDSQRDAADTSIESLETKKLQLRQQLHTIDEKLHAAREGQRNYLAEKDRRRRALEEVEATFRKNLSEVEELGLAARKERAAAEKVKQAAAETEVLAVRALSAAAEDLSAKAAQFDSHLLNVLLEHVGHEEKRIQLLHDESDLCTSIIAKHKAEIDLLTVMDRPLSSVLDAAEHKHLCETSSAAEAALKACAGFARDFGPFLSKHPAAHGRLQKLEADHAEVIRKLAACRQLLGVSTPTMDPTSSLPAAQSSHAQAAPADPGKAQYPANDLPSTPAPSGNAPQQESAKPPTQPTLQGQTQAMQPMQPVQPQQRPQQLTQLTEVASQIQVQPLQPSQQQPAQPDPPKAAAAAVPAAGTPAAVPAAGMPAAVPAPGAVLAGTGTASAESKLDVPT
ncbi:CAS1 [Symbiodinium natans]|uniref:CAS1 protein n=1 Tax=Symbiodinium natans TaxID=878477 RepID=A0A812JCK1_9DINO|nr:CAS1 [Symbiodinium natans]